jgi:colanic acid/amylovoran biosynthesis protein
MLRRIDLVTTREPLSEAMLAYIGINGDHIYATACPSVLFGKKEIEAEMPQNEDFSMLFKEKVPTVGIILCGWNFPMGPSGRWPRESWEYLNFVGMIRYLLENTHYRVCIMSHQNATDNDGNLIKGNDHRIIAQLLKELGPLYDGKRVVTLHSCYNAAESKTIVGTFDLLISGRIHGAVQGLSQYIPTAIIDYGHKPKAHKLKGFARLYGIDDYVMDPLSEDDIIIKLQELINNREQIRSLLLQQVPRIKELALSNFELLRKLSDQ